MITRKVSKLCLYSNENKFLPAKYLEGSNVIKLAVHCAVSEVELCPIAVYWLLATEVTIIILMREIPIFETIHCLHLCSHKFFVHGFTMKVLVYLEKETG